MDKFSCRQRIINIDTISTFTSFLGYNSFHFHFASQREACLLALSSRPTLSYRDHAVISWIGHQSVSKLFAFFEMTHCEFLLKNMIKFISMSFYPLLIKNLADCNSEIFYLLFIFLLIH